VKHKPNDIQTNAFNIHVGPLWEANTYVQFILDPFVVATYDTFYLTQVDKSITQEM
jgi:hypothetical protein